MRSFDCMIQRVGRRAEHCCKVTPWRLPVWNGALMTDTCYLFLEIGIGGYSSAQSFKVIHNMSYWINCWICLDVHSYRALAADRAHSRVIWDCAWIPESYSFATAARDKSVSHSKALSNLFFILCRWRYGVDRRVVLTGQMLPPFTWSILAQLWNSLHMRVACTRTKHIKDIVLIIINRQLMAVGLENGALRLYYSGLNNHETWNLVRLLDLRCVYITFASWS